MQITASITVIKDPSNNVWAKGTISTYTGELWLVTDKGRYRGIYTTNQLPEVFTLVWAMGALNGPAPEVPDDAMKSGYVFSMKKCINKLNCQWILSSQFTNEKILTHQHGRTIHSKDSERRVRHGSNMKHSESRVQKINDPCEAYPDCNSCINAKDYCGWCSINVMYSTSGQQCNSPGKNCVGLNATKIGATFCCGPAPGVTFSTLSCPTNEPPTTPPTKTTPPVTIPPLSPHAPVKPPPPTKKPILYDCNPSNQSCQLSTGPNGMPLEQCNLNCNTIPDVPVILRGRKFRGLQIQNKYILGEYTVKFSETSATFASPSGVGWTALVSQTGPYLVLNMASGAKTYTLWQVQTDSVVDFLSWAWGKESGSPPVSYDAAMTASGQQEYVFDACSTLSTVCNFGTK